MAWFCLSSLLWWVRWGVGGSAGSGVTRRAGRVLAGLSGWLTREPEWDTAAHLDLDPRKRFAWWGERRVGARSAPVRSSFHADFDHPSQGFPVLFIWERERTVEDSRPRTCKHQQNCFEQALQGFPHLRPRLVTQGLSSRQQLPTCSLTQILTVRIILSKTEMIKYIWLIKSEKTPIPQFHGWNLSKC